MHFSYPVLNIIVVLVLSAVFVVLACVVSGRASIWELRGHLVGHGRATTTALVAKKNKNGSMRRLVGVF
jgi:hypothetical protein